MNGIRFWFIQVYFCDGKRRDAVPEALFQKDASRNDVSEPFIRGIVMTWLGLSCFPTALLSNKLAYFLEFLKENYPRPNFGGLCASRNGFLQRHCTEFIHLQCTVAGHDKTRYLKTGKGTKVYFQAIPRILDGWTEENHENLSKDSVCHFLQLTSA
jgi:hypothetical protein